MTESLTRYWDQGIDFESYLEDEVEEHAELWRGIYRKAKVPAGFGERFAEVEGCWRLLVLVEDWCGDASNSVPVIARWAKSEPRVQMRVLARDEHPELMDRFLTNGSRSIPIAILLDGDGVAMAHWGPRPAELQSFVLDEKRAGERPVSEIYKDARRWYARDRGATTLAELLEVFESASREVSASCA